jgi:hypothetical protein
LCYRSLGGFGRPALSKPEFGIVDQESDWGGGYVTEIDYIHGHYAELCPGIMRFACIAAGVAPPTSQPLRYLELAYGQGNSANIHAAATTGEYWGTDFNPSQTAFAQTLAEASGSGAILLNDSFAELAARSDLPEFDVIAMHGIWSWITDENRHTIVDIIRRKLRVGGMLYISYNCFPGQTSLLALRQLLKIHADLAPSNAAGLVGKLNDAMAFAQKVIDAGSLYFRLNPFGKEWLKGNLSKQNPTYLAHEYLNDNWEPMTFAEVARWLDGAKVSFAASANLKDHVDSVMISAEGRQLLEQCKQPILRQTVRDYLVSQQFRRDIFVKGIRRLSLLEMSEAITAESFVLLTAPEDVPRKTKSPIGEVTFQREVYDPLLEVLAEDNYTPKKIGQLATHAKLKSVPLRVLVESLLLLTGMGHTHPARIPDRASRERCRLLNRRLYERARGSGEIRWLASPVTGGGITVLRTEQLFLLAMQHGKKTAAEWAAFVLGIFSSQGEPVIKDGKKLESAEEALADLTKRAQLFADKRVPILKALEVI